MIVFGPIMFLFLFGIFCIIMDIIYNKQEPIDNIIESPKKSEGINWINQYDTTDNEEKTETEYIIDADKSDKYLWDEDSEFLS